MKYTAKILLLFTIATSAFNLMSCKDGFEESIFDTRESIDYLDQNSYTFPLDTFCKVEFLEPYNLKFLYKFEDKGSDMNKNLTPASYDKCVDLAVLSKYLWYDIYKDLAGAEFLKLYSPRIIHVCGSKNYNASKGTETLGDASGGIKINLYNANNLDANNIDMLNEYFFMTMHHEFAHILDQSYLRPTKFNTISNSKYDAAGWNTSADSLKAGLGFVSKYASSAVSEDWAEIIANYVTRDSISWNTLLHSADYDWEEVDCKDYNEYQRKAKQPCNLDTVGYYKPADNGDNKIYRRLCKRDDNDNVVLEPSEENIYKGTKKIENGKPWTIPNIDWRTVKAGSKLKIIAEMRGTTSETSFNLVDASAEIVAENLKWNIETVSVSIEIPITQEMLDKILNDDNPSLSISGDNFTIKQVDLAGEPKVQWLHVSGVDGRAVILEKVDLARTYMKEHYDIDLDKLRKEVQGHTYQTNEDGSFKLDESGRLMNKLTLKMDDNRTLMDHLRDNVNKYRK